VDKIHDKSFLSKRTVYASTYLCLTFFYMLFLAWNSFVRVRFIKNNLVTPFLNSYNFKSFIYAIASLQNDNMKCCVLTL
jgi:hypothetical protein